MINLVAQCIADDFERAQERSFNHERFLEATQ
jgi:hypothetical protein